MSNQEPQNPNPSTENAAVEKRRRFIKSAGIAAPVILSLSSPSVFGAAGQCLSQIMSGNASNNVTLSCTLGHTPSYWSTTRPWPTGLSASSRGTGCSGTGGTTFNNATVGFGVSPTSPIPSGSTMLTVLCTYSTTLDAYLVAALLNAKTPNSDYLYTPAQVIQLKKKTLGVPPLNSTADADVLAFLKTTMA